MRVNCPDCLNHAHITTRKTLSNEVTDLYCSCSEVECGHTFVATLAFKNTINPSRTSTFNIISRLIKTLPKNETEQLLSELKTPKH